MSEPDHENVHAVPRSKLPPTPLLLLAAGIVLAGVGAAWWFMRSASPPPAHPETMLFRQIEEPRLLLAEVFRSYDSETAVATPLEAAGLIVQRSVLERPQSERYPPRRITTFTVEGYRHLDCACDYGNEPQVGEVAQPRLHAGRGVEPEGRAARKRDRIDPLDGGFGR